MIPVPYENYCSKLWSACNNALPHFLLTKSIKDIETTQCILNELLVIGPNFEHAGSQVGEW